MSSKDVARRQLAELVLEVERVLDTMDDPVERLSAADEIRADLAVILTRAGRKSAWQAKTTGAFERLMAAQWRSKKYLLIMAKQYADEKMLPNTMVKDIVTRHVLDITDLARLRGRSR